MKCLDEMMIELVVKIPGSNAWMKCLDQMMIELVV